MKYNILSISILFSSLMIQGCKPGAGHVPADCETIYVDVKSVQEKLDAGFIIDTTYYDFVALETTPECLIAETTKIHIRDNKILIYDEVSHGVFIFTMDGKFHAKIHHIGNGPGEYPPVVNDMVVLENSVGVLVPVLNKIMFYDFDGQFLEEISMQGTWGRTLFQLDNKLHLVNDRSRSSQGNYCLFSLNPEQETFEAHLPFEYDEKVNRGWGLTNHYSLYDERALIIYSTIDTIYEYNSERGIFPRYYVDISENKLPRELAEGDGGTALIAAINEGYIMGVDKIMETENYIILYLSNDYTVFYHKMTKETVIANLVGLHGNHDILFGRYTTLENDLLINSYSANLCKLILEYAEHHQTFQNTDFDRKYKQELMKIKQIDDNPLVSIYRLNNTHLSIYGKTQANNRSQ